MKFRLSADPKANPVGARSVPLGFGRFAEIEPGGEFEVIDPALAANPTFTDTVVFEPVDAEARTVVDEAKRPAEDTGDPDVTSPEPVPEGDDPVLAAVLQAHGLDAPDQPIEVQADPVTAEQAASLPPAQVPGAPIGPDGIPILQPLDDSAPTVTDQPTGRRGR